VKTLDDVTPQARKPTGQMSRNNKTPKLPPVGATVVQGGKTYKHLGDNRWKEIKESQ